MLPEIFHESGHSICFEAMRSPLLMIQGIYLIYLLSSMQNAEKQCQLQPFLLLKHKASLLLATSFIQLRGIQQLNYVFGDII